ncbi:MAG: hypothetical protein H6701_13050 [Myxococcales bacterium]|nr:hypothetical protein [Myxococcales bacterium]
MNRALLPALLPALLIAGAPATRRASAAPVFSHDEHAERLRARGEAVTCTRCHGTEWQIAELRPGSRDHAGCDTAGCHADDFYGTDQRSDALCKVCHTSASPLTSGGLVSFPSRDRASQEMCILFDHVTHLSPARRKERPVDAMCAGCHVLAGADGAKRRASPAHVHCAECHDKADAATPMSLCEGCHESLVSLEKDRLAEGGHVGGRYTTCRPWLPDHGERIVEGFDHDSPHHITDWTTGRALSCDDCHRGAADQSDPRLIRRFPGAATMDRCRHCHNGRTRVPGTERRVFSTSRDCRRCHTETFLNGLLTPPRDHR